jgi:peptidoglycan/LPS O-acetylase OafA/YrhL
VLATAALLGRSVAYPGLVELLDFEAGREALGDALPSDRIFSYHLPYLLPSILMTVLAGVVVAVLARRRKGGRGSAVTGRVAAAVGGAGGALLAAASFYLLPDQLTGWNGEAAVLAAGTAVLTLLVAGLAALGRR